MEVVSNLDDYGIAVKVSRGGSQRVSMAALKALIQRHRLSGTAAEVHAALHAFRPNPDPRQQVFGGTIDAHARAQIAKGVITRAEIEAQHLVPDPNYKAQLDPPAWELAQFAVVDLDEVREALA